MSNATLPSTFSPHNFIESAAEGSAIAEKPGITVDSSVSGALDLSSPKFSAAMERNA
ncbi:hypothetical protein VKT23_012778 [Stygiomarasmius scandens]|uniref:Uncharacterized protein n=1 Tax=Marasmiellus scandens TaxID=2682957 RepID=A0ABR1JA47_9AGAR